MLSSLVLVNILLIHGLPNSLVNSALTHIPALRVCLPGPYISSDDQIHSNEHQRKCLIVGDSISIGYTPGVRKALNGKCRVYHAPWDIADGGALDTKHGITCLGLLELSSIYNHITYDVIVFNFGLHDVNCDNDRPEEFTDLRQYRENLMLLKKHFLHSNAKVVYAMTTPVLDDCDVNKLVVKYNDVANDVMCMEPKVEVVDLYKVVTARCGEVPWHRKAIDCPITNSSLIPHYTPLGYKLLAEHVVDGIMKVFEETTGDKSGSSMLWTRESQATEKELRRSNIVYCTERGAIRSACPPKSTCVPNPMSGSGFACCLSENAVDCKTGVHCCPAGTKCSINCTNRRCRCVRHG